MMEQAYFLTVDWCKRGQRGVFCRSDGAAFRKDEEPHSKAEIDEILGPFWLVLSPLSLLLTEAQLAEYTQFVPLAEYSHQYGIACKAAPEAEDR